MISQLYIEKILQLYSLTERQKGDLLKKAPKADSLFAEYRWEDVERGINEFFKKKNSDTPPTPEQVYAFVSTSTKAKRTEKSDVEDIVKPHTNIKMIQDCYYDVCRLKYMYGIAFSDYFAKVEKLQHGNKMRVRIKNNAPGKPIEYELVNIAWIWQDAVVEAKKRFPEVFEKFKYANENEQYAIAYKLGVLKLDLTKGKK